MRVLILGAGSIGGYFGGRLAAAGVDVTFLVRSGRAAQLAKDGLDIMSPLGNLRLQVKTAERVNQPFDLTLLACKAYDLESAMQAIAPALAEGSIVVPLLNGLRHLDSLDDRFPAAHILGGLCHIGVTLTGDGKIQHLNALQHLKLGHRSPKDGSASEAAHAMLVRGGFSPVLSQSIMQDMWEKFVFLTSYAGITCMMKAPIGTIARTSEGASIAGELLDECIAVAIASGFAPRPQFIAESQKTLTDGTSAGTSSMLRDLRRGARTEHNHILGDMLMRASTLGVATPVLRIAATVLNAHELTLSESAT